MRMHPEGVKNAYPQITRSDLHSLCNLWTSVLSIPAPASVVFPITTSVTASAADRVEITIAVAAMASEDIGETAISIWSSTVPTSITRVMAVNKLLALIEVATSAPPAPLAHGISRHANQYHETQNKNSK